MINWMIGKRQRTLWLGLFGVLLLLPMAAQAQSWWPFGGEGMDYTIRFEQADPAMQAWFTTLKLDMPTETHPPTTMDELDQESNSLAARVKKALEAKGYMESQAEPQVDKAVEPPVVTIAVDQGVRYPLREVRVEWQGSRLQEIDPATLTSKAHAPLDMEAIEADALAINTRIAKDSCLLSLSVTPKLKLYSTTRDAVLVFVIAHGPRANFGPSVTSGNTTVHDSVIARGTTWKQGQCFDASKIEATRTGLIQNQLFSSVQVTAGDAPDANGEVPVTIAVKERVARTIGAGVDYSTDNGFGTHASWEHRNLWGDAQKLTGNVTVSERVQGVDSNLRIPGFQRDDQTLSFAAALNHQNTDAYRAFTFDGSATVERRLSKRLNSGLGIGYTLSNTEDVLSGTNNYALISLPGFLEYDGRDNALDARKGLFARLAATPYTETVGDGGQFIKLLATGQAYVSSDDIHWQPTLATRLSVGSIVGSKGNNVPSDIRFYAGGGGSVRGYSYQSLAPYVAGKPVGGASLIEGSAEMRLRFTPTIGGVLFMDGGNATTDTAPDLSQKIYYSAGVGGRYYSAIGPLRMDIAFPINGADIGQTGYQFYVSLGQSF